MISHIRSPLGNTFTNPLDINKCFEDFYTNLYKSESRGDTSLFNSFYEGLDIPQISSEFKALLDQPISCEEVSHAILSLQNGKAPGPDGFTAEFFKATHNILAGPMIDMLNEALITGLLPISLRQISISLIAKKDKDPLDCANYRPISLCPVDVKILAKILALRMEPVLAELIHNDQTGFIKSRKQFFNIRRVLNVIYSPSNVKSQEVLVLLDAEKAFDRVEWDFLFDTLHRFGFREKFIRLIQLLYTSPFASVRTNDISSPYFKLHRGTRQGCPLSPLLFVLALEPLAIAIRSDNKVTGIIRGGLEQRISLYADDIILFISNPTTSLPRVLSCIKEFGVISKLNIDKSELFPLNTGGSNISHLVPPHLNWP